MNTQNTTTQKASASADKNVQKPVCPNCGQWQTNRKYASAIGTHYLDCFNDCAERGFVPKEQRDTAQHSPLPKQIAIGKTDGELVDENGFYLGEETKREIVRRYNNAERAQPPYVTAETLYNAEKARDTYKLHAEKLAEALKTMLEIVPLEYRINKATKALRAMGRGEVMSEHDKGQRQQAWDKIALQHYARLGPCPYFGDAGMPGGHIYGDKDQDDHCQLCGQPREGVK
jgi:hypothetical protein